LAKSKELGILHPLEDTKVSIRLIGKKSWLGLPWIIKKYSKEYSKGSLLMMLTSGKMIELEMNITSKTYVPTIQFY